MQCLDVGTWPCFRLWLMKGAAKSGMEVEKSCHGLYISIIRYIK